MIPLPPALVNAGGRGIVWEEGCDEKGSAREGAYTGGH
jgi:hypothetical protein